MLDSVSSNYLLIFTLMSQALLVYFMLSGLWDGLMHRSIYRRVNLSPWRYSLKGFDVSENPRPFYLRRKINGVGLRGSPDFVFRDRLSGRYLVIDYKKRPHDGKVSSYELFQMTLYLGLINRFWLPEAKGKLLYSDKMVDVSLNPEILERLTKEYGAMLLDFKAKTLDSLPEPLRVLR